jgi:uncharacterized protein (DUF433 family)
MSARRVAEPWRARLRVPAFRIQDAARYADISANTVARWHDVTGVKRTPAKGKPVLSSKGPREALSYLQLIELAVVASMRAAGVKLEDIRASREYLATQLKSEYPLAEYEFKTDGKALLIDYQQLDESGPAEVLIESSKGGQLTWHEALKRRLDEFEYEGKGIAHRWWVRGRNQPIVIDPTIAFGSPSVGSVPTWAVRQHWDAGEGLDDISDDLGIERSLVEVALKFEGIQPNRDRPNLWAS